MSFFLPRMLYTYIFLLVALSRGALASLQDKQTDFGLKVFYQMSQGSVEKNLVLSPYGVTSIMSMAQLGANGSTRKALTTAMGFSLRGEWIIWRTHEIFLREYCWPTKVGFIFRLNLQMSEIWICKGLSSWNKHVFINPITFQIITE